MKLKDKIECSLERHVKLKENQSENIEKIADEFATGFLEWYLKHQRTICTNEMYLRKSNKELLEIYKNQNEL